ncbi:hypothetical protein RDI58_032805 [Solanum bulbocastanum]|uniref:Uncharacterized protein n=1 Tax=Solanum bulbocastanum TaxID=147425 RepID=A0AAN8XV45_SOLBU
MYLTRLYPIAIPAYTIDHHPSLNHACWFVVAVTSFGSVRRSGTFLGCELNDRTSTTAVTLLTTRMIAEWLQETANTRESESQSTGIALHSKIPQRKQAASQSAHSILSQFFSFYDRSKGNGPTRNGPIREKGQDMVLRSEQGMLSRRVMQIVIYLNS